MITIAITTMNNIHETRTCDKIQNFPSFTTCWSPLAWKHFAMFSTILHQISQVKWIFVFDFFWVEYIKILRKIHRLQCHRSFLIRQKIQKLFCTKVAYFWYGGQFCPISNNMAIICPISNIYASNKIVLKRFVYLFNALYYLILQCVGVVSSQSCGKA